MQYLSTSDYVVISFIFMLWRVTMYLAPMQPLIREWEAFGVTVVLHCGALVAMYFMWYRHLPTAAVGHP